MGTANFHYVNANRVYVIRDSYQDEEYGIFRLDWDDIKSRVQEFSKDNEGWDKCNKYFRFGLERDTGVLCKEFLFKYRNSNLCYPLTVYLTINSGYYECCNLDYRFVFQGNECDEDFDDIVGQMADDFTNDYTCGALSYLEDPATPTWNIGLRKMQERNFRKAANDFLLDIKNKCEQMCFYLSDNTYRCIARASNGEVFYEEC